MSIPHKHAEIIKAWADGYAIEAYNPERDSWISVAEPGWFNDIEYRVKPGVIEKPQEIFEEYVIRLDQDPFDADKIEVTDECSKYEHYNLKVLFRNGELYAAEVMNQEEEPTQCGDLPW